MLGFFKAIFLKPTVAVGEYSSLVAEVFVTTLKKPPSWFLIADQMLNVGVLSLLVVAITGFSTGLVLAAQSFFQLADKGLAGATGVMVAKAMIVELGPTLTAFMITGRVGAAMCAELGTMKVTEQLDALRSMAVDPLRHLIAPRCLAGTLMLPLLTIFGCVTGILGGFLISVYLFGMSPIDFFDTIPHNVTLFDLASGCIKALVFGALISTICCYKGMTTKGGAAGVGRTTTQSVVICYTMILIFNFLLTLALNMLHR